MGEDRRTGSEEGRGEGSAEEERSREEGRTEEVSEHDRPTLKQMAWFGDEGGWQSGCLHRDSVNPNEPTSPVFTHGRFVFAAVDTTAVAFQGQDCHLGLLSASSGVVCN